MAERALFLLDESTFTWIRLPDELCDLFLLSIIVARNYDAYFALPGVNKSVFGIIR